MKIYPKLPLLLHFCDWKSCMYMIPLRISLIIPVYTYSLPLLLARMGPLGASSSSVDRSLLQMQKMTQAMGTRTARTIPDTMPALMVLYCSVAEQGTRF